MSRLHTFGCSITQGHALPDIVTPVRDSQGRELEPDQVQQLMTEGTVSWEDIHQYQASRFAWPQVLADRLGFPVNNHARRGACFNQIARQVAQHGHTIEPDDVVIVMWTYMSRVSIQWPTRTAVPFCNIADSSWGFRSMVLGFNRLFGLSNSKKDEHKDTQEWIRDTAERVHLDPRGQFDRYYRNLTLQIMTDGYLRNTGAGVIHLSVETESALDQTQRAQQELDDELGKEYTMTPDPREWYTLQVDYNCAPTILDPRIPLAPNDMHPSVEHHSEFARLIERRYFL